MKKFGLRFLSRTGKEPMICEKINKIKSSQKNIHNQKLRELKSTHHHSREVYRGNPSWKERSACADGPIQVIQ